MGLAAMGLMGCGGYGRGPGEKSEVGEDEVREQWGRGRSIVRVLRGTRQHEGGLGRHARERGIFIVVSWNVEGGRARVRMEPSREYRAAALSGAACKSIRYGATGSCDRITACNICWEKSDQSDGDQVSDGEDRRHIDDDDDDGSRDSGARVERAVSRLPLRPCPNARLRPPPAKLISTGHLPCPRLGYLRSSLAYLPGPPPPARACVSTGLHPNHYPPLPPPRLA